VTERAEDGSSGFVTDVTYGSLVALMTDFWAAVASADAARAADVLYKATWNSPMAPLYVVELSQQKWVEPPAKPRVFVHVLCHKEEGFPEILEEAWTDTLFALIESSRIRERLAYYVTVSTYASTRTRSGDNVDDMAQVAKLIQIAIPSRE